MQSVYYCSSEPCWNARLFVLCALKHLYVLASWNTSTTNLILTKIFKSVSDQIFCEQTGSIVLILYAFAFMNAYYVLWHLAFHLSEKLDRGVLTIYILHLYLLYELGTFYFRCLIARNLFSDVVHSSTVVWLLEIFWVEWRLVLKFFNTWTTFKIMQHIGQLMVLFL